LYGFVILDSGWQPCQEAGLAARPKGRDVGCQPKGRAGSQAKGQGCWTQKQISEKISKERSTVTF